MREEVQAYLQACTVFVEFVQHNELTTAEREAIGNVFSGVAQLPAPGSDPIERALPSRLPGQGPFN